VRQRSAERLFRPDRKEFLALALAVGIKPGGVAFAPDARESFASVLADLISALVLPEKPEVLQRLDPQVLGKSVRRSGRRPSAHWRLSGVPWERLPGVDAYMGRTT
jgi:hypothetical protein